MIGMLLTALNYVNGSARPVPSKCTFGLARLGSEKPVSLHH